MDHAFASPPAVSLTRRGLIIVGLGWSLFGLLQFCNQSFSDVAGLVAGGMTPEQAALYASLPLWMTLAFGIGTIGGTIGCVLLLAGRRAAVPVLATSLASYIALFAGDVVYGVFAAFGATQVVVLSLVVLIAAGLLRLAAVMRRHGQLG